MDHNGKSGGMKDAGILSIRDKPYVDELVNVTKMFSIKNWLIFLINVNAYLLTFTKEIFNGKLHLLRSITWKLFITLNINFSRLILHFCYLKDFMVSCNVTFQARN